ncbi:MAG: autotransporter assembly complex protein TamA [Woeseiaceae bacterium]
MNLSSKVLLRNLVLFCLCLLCATEAAHAELTFVVTGVDDPLRENVLHYVDSMQLGGRARLSDNDVQRIRARAIDQSRAALRPYGYYSPTINDRLTQDKDGQPVIELSIEPGPPIIVDKLELEIIGAGAKDGRLQAWQRQWPLKPGTRLEQLVWEEQKQRGMEIAEAFGYLSSGYREHSLELDLEQNTAAVRLVMDTGERFVIGDVDFGEHVLNPGVVENLLRFESGDPYSAQRLQTLRMDLGKSGYFTDFEVVEERRPDRQPPAVDLKVLLETKSRSFYRGALGYGSDTGARLQGQWSRHPMSGRGDRVDVGLGWQETNDEFAIRSLYVRPLRKRAREYWTADLTLKSENEDLEVRRTQDDEDAIKIANGDVKERHLRLGRLKVRNFESGNQELFSTPFVQYLNSDRRFGLDGVPPEFMSLAGEPEFDRLLNTVDNAISIGVDLDLVSVHGRAFETHGHRERAWLFSSQDAFGSEVEFTQLYLSTRQSYRFGDRWKVLLRAEAGYTDADVDDFSVDLDGERLDLSVTHLPNFYRFKAGGSRSVRGYSFEQLSNNDVGSNNLLTASVELEFKVLENWSGAIFADIGNAFNDWSDSDLKKGVGVGIRWYSIVGPIRVDIAQALDFDDKPWRLHFTMGTPLL